MQLENGNRKIYHSYTNMTNIFQDPEDQKYPGDFKLYLENSTPTLLSKENCIVLKSVKVDIHLTVGICHFSHEIYLMKTALAATC